MEYCNHQYVLCASKTGTMQEVHYNTRTMAPLKGPADSVQPFYEAYKWENCIITHPCIAKIDTLNSNNISNVFLLEVFESSTTLWDQRRLQ